MAGANIRGENMPKSDIVIILRRADIRRLERRKLACCRLPICAKAFIEGDQVKKIGVRYFHFPLCYRMAFVDWNEPDDCEGEEAKC